METLAESTEEFHVKCCSDKLVNVKFQEYRITGFYKHVDLLYDSLTVFRDGSQYRKIDVKLDVCPYHLVDEEQCPGKLNHNEAVEYCHEKGGRLCTSEELWNGCANGGPDSCSTDL